MKHLIAALCCLLIFFAACTPPPEPDITENDADDDEVEEEHEEIPVEVDDETEDILYTTLFAFDNVQEYVYNAETSGVTATITTTVERTAKEARPVYVLTNAVDAAGVKTTTVMTIDIYTHACLEMKIHAMVDHELVQQTLPCPTEGLNSAAVATAPVVFVEPAQVTVPAGTFDAEVYTTGSMQFWLGDAPVPVKYSGPSFSMELVSYS
ncbi:MAG: hypothetical protein OXR66_01620 [Candidatus Woesearchaeota archaeon]|nr:hypothetical protein [Candidatus Woesearchaeota archaeon]